MAETKKKTTTTTKKEKPVEEIRNATVNASMLNIRKEARIDSDIIKTVPQGTVLKVLDYKKPLPEFVKVEIEVEPNKFETCYCMSGFLKF